MRITSALANTRHTNKRGGLGQGLGKDLSIIYLSISSMYVTIHVSIHTLSQSRLPLLVDGGGVEVVHLHVGLGPDGVGTGTTVLTELTGTQHLAHQKGGGRRGQLGGTCHKGTRASGKEAGLTNHVYISTIYKITLAHPDVLDTLDGSRPHVSTELLVTEHRQALLQPASRHINRHIL